MEEQKTENPITVTSAAPQKVVVFGRHDYILQNMENLLQKSGYETAGFLDMDETRDYMRMSQIDGLLIGGGVEPHDRLEIVKFVQTEFPHVKIVEHFGGPATIISEVKKALETNS